jgi:hypothetical protein
MFFENRFSFNRDVVLDENLEKFDRGKTLTCLHIKAVLYIPLNNTIVFKTKVLIGSIF